MRTYILKIGSILLRAVLWLRYRVRYVGLEDVIRELSPKNGQGKNPNGILFLPNHPAVVVDPIIVSLPLLGTFNIRPLITEYMYYNPAFHWVMRFIRALPVPNFAVGVNPLKLDRLQKSLQEVGDGLERGESFLLYPAGTTKVGPREIIGGAFAAYDLLTKHPGTKVVLVRTVGLWGSRFSRAHTKGKQVDMPFVLRHAVRCLFKSLIFFLPRRPVTVEFQVVDVQRSEEESDSASKLPLYQGRNECNKWLEAWYNKPFEEEFGAKAGEPLELIPESMWSEDLPVPPPYDDEELQAYIIPDDIQKVIVEKIAELASRPVETIRLQDHLVADVGLDSLNIAELVSFIEVRYDIRGINPQEMNSVRKACLFASGQVILEKELVDPPLDTTLWEKPREVKRLFVPEAETLVDAFFTACHAQASTGIAGDARAGIVTYSRIRSGVALLAREIAKYEGDTIGILLPASLTANMLIFAAQLAGKTPVMINWTVGGNHLEAVVRHANLSAVLTSWSFLDRLENVDLSPIKDILVILEEAKATFSWGSYAVAKLMSFVPWEWVKKYTSLFPHWQSLSAESRAVILFTSGTESMPKGVPLTHGNILSNLRASLHTMEIFSSDRLLSMLPPFHSFGFAITGIMPLIVGLRVFYSPNPLDAPRLTHALRYWKATLLCSAPSFLKTILRQVKEDQPIQSLRLIVSGAERTPDDLYALLAKTSPHASFIEGYGITECSPVLTVNLKGRGYGVGKPLPNVRLKIVDPENYSVERTAEHESGMILVAGPNVFHGYLQRDIASPFFQEGATKWYVTGDIGLVDAQGFVHITGRLKRFAKIGGEMVSLGAIEDALERVFQPQILKWNEEREKERRDISSRPTQNIAGASFAVIAQGEEEGRPKLRLCTVYPLDVVEVNMALRKSGFSTLVKVDSVHHFDELPLMGTGKVAYRALESSLQLA